MSPTAEDMLNELESTDDGYIHYSTILPLIKKIKSEWISVEDKLPEPGKNVIVWVAEDFNCVDIGRHNGNLESFCNGWDTNGDLSKYRYISHWMASPNQPQ